MNEWRHWTQEDHYWWCWAEIADQRVRLNRLANEWRALAWEMCTEVKT